MVVAELATSVARAPDRPVGDVMTKWALFLLAIVAGFCDSWAVVAVAGMVWFADVAELAAASFDRYMDWQEGD